MQTSLKKIEYGILFLTAGISIVIAVLDISGALDSVNWIVRRIPALILLGVGFLATYLVIERRGKIEDISVQLAKLSKGIEAEMFHSSEEAISYLATALTKARAKIDQASLHTEYIGRTPAIVRFLEQRDKVIKLGAVKFRYVATLPSKRRLEKSKVYKINLGLTNYFVGFYLQESLRDMFFRDIPSFSFTIIDDKEVFSRYLFDHGEDAGYIVRRNQHVVKFFSDYFNTLWKSAFKLKDENDLKILQSRFEETAN